MQFLAVIPVVLVLTALLWFNARMNRERRSMWQSFAESEGLQFYDRKVPAQYGPVLPFLLGVRNCVAGTRLGEEVICYEYPVFQRNRHWASAVGCQQAHPERSAAALGDFTRVKRAGNWLLLSYSPWSWAQHVNPDEVLATWDMLRTLNREPSSPGGVLIRPRHNRL